MNLQLPDTLQSIGSNAFRGCTGIVDLHLPDTPQSVGTHAFHDCMSIVNLRLPATLQSIANSACDGCTGLVALQLPDTLQSIGSFAFYACTGIVDLQLPGTLQSIGSNAFRCCTGIFDLNLPDTLRSIREGNGSWSKGAFHGRASLARVLAPGSLVRGEMADPTKIFSGCPVLATGMTPLSSVRLLQHTLWHPTMHSWCTLGQRRCVLAVLVAELR